MHLMKEYQHQFQDTIRDANSQPYRFLLLAPFHVKLKDKYPISS